MNDCFEELLVLFDAEMKEEQRSNNNTNTLKSHENLDSDIPEQTDEKISFCDIQLRKMEEERKRQELEIKSFVNECKKKEVEMKKKEMEILRKKEEKKILEDIKKLNSMKKNEVEKLHLEFETRQKQLQDQHTKEVLALERKEKELENLQRQNLQTKETQTENNNYSLVEMDQSYLNDIQVCSDIARVSSPRLKEVNNQTSTTKTSFTDNKILENISKIKSDINALYIQKEENCVPKNPIKVVSSEVLNYVPNLKTDLILPTSNNQITPSSFMKDSCNNLQCSKSKICKRDSGSKFESMTETVSVGNVKKSIERWNNILNSKTVKGSRNYDSKLPYPNFEKENKKFQTPIEYDKKFTQQKESDGELFISSSDQAKTLSTKQFGNSKNWKYYLDQSFPTFYSHQEQSSMLKSNSTDIPLSPKSTFKTESKSIGDLLLSPKKTGAIEESIKESQNNNGLELTITCGCPISTLKILTPKNYSLTLNNPENKTLQNPKNSQNIIKIGPSTSSNNISTFIEDDKMSSALSSTKMTQNERNRANISYLSKLKAPSNLSEVRSSFEIHSLDNSLTLPKLLSAQSNIQNSKKEDYAFKVNEIENKNSKFHELKYREYAPNVEKGFRHVLKDIQSPGTIKSVEPDLNSTFIIDEENEKE